MACLRVPSKTESPVVLTKSASRMESFSVRARARRVARKPPKTTAVIIAGRTIQSKGLRFTACTTAVETLMDDAVCAGAAALWVITAGTAVDRTGEWWYGGST